MGRSDLQGTPWHYEYAKSERVCDSTNCVFNIGYCSCKASVNHKNKCAGKLNCDEFEKQMKSLKHKDIKNIKSQQQSAKQQKFSSNKSTKTKKNVKIISIGNNIVVVHYKTNEQINISIRDSKNPFVGKRLDEIVTIKGEMYSIRKIMKIKNS